MGSVNNTTNTHLTTTVGYKNWLGQGKITDIVSYDVQNHVKLYKETSGNWIVCRYLAQFMRYLLIGK